MIRCWWLSATDKSHFIHIYVKWHESMNLRVVFSHLMEIDSKRNTYKNWIRSYRRIQNRKKASKMKKKTSYC